LQFTCSALSSREEWAKVRGINSAGSGKGLKLGDLERR
jgi:hypothetical protein